VHELLRVEDELQFAGQKAFGLTFDYRLRTRRKNRLGAPKDTGLCKTRPGENLEGKILFASVQLEKYLSEADVG
jgi:hypothetical protein